ncbi:MAG: hypothetical protein GX624_08100 [Actinobacteria bacterium]|nr:hypothetical protein [Actinomycetota bacterium]
MSTLRHRIAGLPGVPAARRALGVAPPRRPRPADYHRPIREPADSCSVIRDVLRRGEPALIARMGGFELECLMHHRRARRRLPRRPYPEHTVRVMGTNAGYFPVSDETLDAFVPVYLDAISAVDVMGVWFNIGEELVVRKVCPRAELVPLWCIEPYYHELPWSCELEGRRVLVVHPMTESITAQYARRELLFPESPDVLPPFELLLLPAVQSAAGEQPPFRDWFAALASMKAAMDELDYEVCIIGAGAYGLPLAAHAKRRGRVAVHMGGATQILFGIKGRRWDEHAEISRLYNDAWVRPRPCEVPRDAAAVEGGCYW